MNIRCEIRKIVNCFLDMCETTSVAAEAAYNALNGKISQLLDTSEPLHNCTSVGVDNTSANASIRNSLKTKIIARNDCRYRRSPIEVLLGKDVLKICSKFTREHPCRSVISLKLLCNFLEISFQHECSPVNVLHIFKAPFYKNSYGGLLPYIFQWLPMPYNSQCPQKLNKAFACKSKFDVENMMFDPYYFFSVYFVIKISTV